MPTYELASASVAASATNENVINGQKFERTTKPRTLKAVGFAVLDNTPANADLTVKVFIGEIEVVRTRAGLVRTTGRELQAEDYLPVNLTIDAGAQLRVEVQNTDAGAAHSCLLGLAIDGFGI